MTTRITDQFVEVLFQGEGVIRATRAYVEVLRSVAQAPGAVHEVEVGQSLGLVSTPFVNWDKTVHFSQSMTLADDPDGFLSYETSDFLGFEDLAQDFLYVGNVQHIFDELGLDDDVFGDNASVQETYDALLFQQTLSFIGPRYESTNNGIYLNHEPQYYLGVPWLPILVVDELELVDRLNRDQFASVLQTITFIQQTYRIFKLTDTLSFVQTISYGKGGILAPQPLGLEQAVNRIVEYRRSPQHVSFIFDAGTLYIDSPCNQKRYMPFDGAGPGEAMPEKPLAFKSDFLLETLSGPKQILRLRAPEPDDTERLGFNRVNRETRGGELNVFSDPNWPKVDTLLFTIVALKQTKINALHQFLLDTLGQEIKLQDWTGTAWRGVVTTPGEIYTEDGVDAWTITFEFEGTPYVGQSVNESLGLAFASSASAVLVPAGE